MFDSVFGLKTKTVYRDEFIEIDFCEVKKEKIKENFKKFSEALKHAFIEENVGLLSAATVGAHLVGVYGGLYDIPNYDIFTHVLGVATVRYGASKLGEYFWSDIEEKAGKYLTLGAVVVSGLVIEGVEYLLHVKDSLGDGNILNTLKDVFISNPAGAAVSHELIKKGIL